MVIKWVYVGWRQYQVLINIIEKNHIYEGVTELRQSGIKKNQELYYSNDYLNVWLILLKKKIDI